VLDQFVRFSQNEEALHPGILGIRLERGFMYGDIQRVFSRVKGSRSFPRAWETEAHRQELLARAAEEAGHVHTAAQHRHRAALYYGRAQHLTPGSDMTRKRQRYDALRRNYTAMIDHLHGRVTHHQVEFAPGQKAFYLVFRAPGAGPRPTVLYVPGMDATKEDYPSPFLNDFLVRGMNVVAMDGPGQGEARMDGVALTIENYPVAASAVLDEIVGLDEVDEARIGCFGTSMGTYWSVLTAAADPRIKAVAGQMPNVGTKEVIFNQAQPNFRRIYKFMMDVAGDDEFDAIIPRMDRALAEAGHALAVPYLLVGGDLDELTPVNHIESWFASLTCPKELWLYNDVFHPMGEVVSDAYPDIADWMSTALDGGIPPEHSVRREIDPNQVPRPTHSQEAQ
jgi:pimeloyl-ACP methyl ester carboxylesterase